DAGLQQVDLDDADSIAFADPGLQDKVNTALARIAAYRDPGHRRLSLAIHGSGKRVVRVGYVVAMPLWKASYRLSLPADPKTAEARLQGWAVLENFSGQDWNDIDLTLVSGNPVTFRQALYESYYVPRPVVPVEAGGHVLPPADTGSLGPVAQRQAALPPPAPAPAPASMAKSRAGGVLGFGTASAEPPPPPPPPAPIEAAEAREGATQIAFSLPAKVSVQAGQSLVLPLLDRDLPARQVDLYRPATDTAHPLATVELTNASASGLPPGVLTLYRQSADRGATYLGDARLTALPAGDKRLLSFAVDNKVAISTTTAHARHIVKATVSQGVIHLTRTNRRATTYRIKAAAAVPPLLLEQPKMAGWKLVAPDPKTVETTSDAYRIPVTLPTGNEAEIAVAEEEPVQESIALSDLDGDRLGVFASSTELDPALRKALAGLATQRADIARKESELDRLKAEKDQLVEDESRYRDNLAALGNSAALRTREIAKLTEAENRIDQVSAAIATAGKSLDAAKTALAAAISGITL